jgi:hypothetical protein
MAKSKLKSVFHAGKLKSSFPHAGKLKSSFSRAGKTMRKENKLAISS